MNLPSTESRLVRERLMPRISIRFFIFLIGISAVVMFIFRAAVVTDQSWAKIVSLIIATTIGCFLAYAFLFLVAHLFNVTTLPIREAIHSAQDDQRREVDQVEEGDQGRQCDQAHRDAPMQADGES